jgi:hypothetical protein
MPPKHAGLGSRRRREPCNNRVVPSELLRWRWWNAAVTWISPCRNVFSGSWDSSQRLSQASCAAKNSPGRSLGSGVAVWIASQRPIARIILVTPFDSLADVASEQYRFVPVRWLLRDKFESWRYAPTVKAQTRIIVAEDDELVPRFSSDRLRSRFQEGLVFYIVVPKVGHNTIQDSPEYWALLNGD